MRLIAPLAILAVALAALFWAPSSAPILGVSHADFAAAAVGVSVLVFLVARSGAVELLRVLVSAAIWATLLLGLWFGYDHRGELVDIAERALDQIGGGSEPSVGASGEVTFRRSLGGEFVITAKVNDRPVQFIFDTGASTVVLTAEDAHRIGLDASALVFSADVYTANGAARAAPTRLAQIAIGPIVVRNIRALVTQPGAMQQSLLGMSFLEQLESYGVERGRLTLKAR